MLIVVTSNDSKKNSMLLGKNKRVDFNCDTCQVRVLNVSCLCAVWKLNKKAGFVTQTLKRTRAIRNDQIYRLNSLLRRFMLLNYICVTILSYISGYI